jgi:hypothetical protein
LGFALLLFSRGSSSEVGLMFASLRVSEVGAIVLVDGQTESALEAADVVFEKVRVLVEVDGL